MKSIKSQEFIQTGLTVEQNRKAKRQRLFTVGAVSIIVLLVALSGWAIRNAGIASQAQQNAEAASTVAAYARATAEAATVDVERLTRGIRADPLTVNGLKVVDKSPPLALLLAVEGIRAQYDYTQTVPYTDTRIVYDFTQARYITQTQVITGRETVVSSAQTTMQELLNTIGGVPLSGHTDVVNSVAISPDGHWLATAAGTIIDDNGHTDDRTARLWDLTAADPTSAPIVLQGHLDSVRTVAFSHDSRWLATGAKGHNSHEEGRSVRLWDLTAMDPAVDPIVLGGHQGGVLALAFSPDDHWLVTTSGNEYGISSDYSAHLWNLKSADPSVEPIILWGYKDHIGSVAFSPDGHWLATNSWDGTIRLWDLKARNFADAPSLLQHITSRPVAVAFSNDGHWLAFSRGYNVYLWDLTAADFAIAEPDVLHGHTDNIN